ncbi:MAG: M48 family metalloprotease [Acidimicrobiales bacterium]
MPRSNGRRAADIVVVPAVVMVAAGVGIGAAAGAVAIGAAAGAVAAILFVTWLWRRSLPTVLNALGAEELDEDDAPNVATLVEGLCASMGLSFPDLYVVDDPAPNALALGRRRKDAALVVTSGLLGAFDPVELEAVLAHELSHVKHDDIAPATVAAALVLRSGLGGHATVHRLARRGREFRADCDAVAVTRYPPGLRNALAAMAEASPGALARSRAGRVTKWLWTCALGGTDAVGTPEGETDAPAFRVSALDEW